MFPLKSETRSDSLIVRGNYVMIRHLGLLDSQNLHKSVKIEPKVIKTNKRTFI